MIAATFPNGIRKRFSRRGVILLAQAKDDLAKLMDPTVPGIVLTSSFAVGVILGFLPFPFVDAVVLALLIRYCGRINRPAMLAGKMVWNELLVAPLYFPALRLGSRLLVGFEAQVSAAWVLPVAGFLLGIAVITITAAVASSLVFLLTIRLLHSWRSSRGQVTRPGFRSIRSYRFSITTVRRPSTAVTRSP